MRYFCSVGGVQPQSETVWRQANRYTIPRIVFVNKMDRTGANFFKVYEQIKDRLKANAIPIQIPIGSEDHFSGVVDLVTMKAVVYANDMGTDIEEVEIPEDLQEKAKFYRTQLIEAVAETDDSLMEKYFEGSELTEVEVRTGLRNGTIDGSIVPMMCGTAFKKQGRAVALWML